jgi:phage virion morphogenesis protein
MAGATLTTHLDSTQAQHQLRRAADAWGNPTPILRAIGTGLARNTRQRFDLGVDPDGHPWEELNPAYEMGKKGPGILRESGMRGGLQGSITFDVAGRELAVGSNKIYAAVHQFGAVIRPKNGPYLIFRMGGALVKARQVTIPARAYLGFGDEDEDTVLDVAEAFLDRARRR